MRAFNLTALFFLLLAFLSFAIAGPSTNLASNAMHINKWRPEIPGLSRRGIAYNNVDYVYLFQQDQRHTTWCYNWDSRPYRDTPVEFVPMLHSMRDDHTSPWRDNVYKAINGNLKTPTHVLGFNEPDNCVNGAGGSCISVDDAIRGWKTHIQPLKSAKRPMYLGSPAVTNAVDTPSTGLGWLRSFMQKCDGCDIDFITIHWYASTPNVAYFKQHINAARDVAQGRPIWITEFKIMGSADVVKGFLDEVMPWLDESDDVHRYAYFMATTGDGFLINDKGDGLSDLGSAYQFA